MRPYEGYESGVLPPDWQRGGSIGDQDGRLRAALARVVERARAEARAGAPGGMVAWYVSVEAEHIVADHDGDAQACDECNQTAAVDRRRWQRRQVQ